jgi:hypothetical protein
MQAPGHVVGCLSAVLDVLICFRTLSTSSSATGTSRRPLNLVSRCLCCGVISRHSAGVDSWRTWLVVAPTYAVRWSFDSFATTHGWGRGIIDRDELRFNSDSSTRRAGRDTGCGELEYERCKDLVLTELTLLFTSWFQAHHLIDVQVVHEWQPRSCPRAVRNATWCEHEVVCFLIHCSVHANESFSLQVSFLVIRVLGTSLAAFHFRQPLVIGTSA